jgi:D-alanyl-D-alanine dipeptidase
MGAGVFCLLAILGAAFAAPPDISTPSTRLVELNKIIPDIVLDIRYATTDNFTGKVVYPSPRCFLAEDAANALRDVQADLEKQGYKLKVFDGYRPLSVQWMFWKIMPDPRYVADPRVGSKHNRGYAVDASLLTLSGEPVSMPTEFDDFSERAKADYPDFSKEILEHRLVLRKTMEKHGFRYFETEWWHFDYQGWENKPILDIPLDSISSNANLKPVDAK